MTNHSRYLNPITVPLSPPVLCTLGCSAAAAVVTVVETKLCTFEQAA